MKSNANKKALGIAFAAILLLALFTACFMGITSAQTSETEPNNEFGDANLIPLDTPTTAAVYPAGDYDWFKVSVTATGVLNISVTSIPPGMRADIQLYDANNHRIAGVTAETPGTPVSLVRDVTPADLFIRVRDYAGGSYTTPYTLFANFEEIADAYEPNGDFAHASEMLLNMPIQAYIFPAGDHDWFKVNVSTGVLNISVTNVPTYMRPRIELYNADGGRIAYMTGTTGKNTTLTRDVHKGTHFLRIDDSDGKSHTSPYTLTASLLEVPDTYEPNGDFIHASEIAVDTPVRAYIFLTGDHDWFKVNLTQRSELKIFVSSVPTYMRPRIELYNENRERIAYTTGSTASNTSLTRDVLAGVYFFRIDDYNGRSHTTPYTLTISATSVPDAYEPNYDFAHASLLTSTGTYNAYIFPAGDYDHYKFSVASSGTLTVSVSNIPSPYMQVRIELYNKNLERVESATAPSPGSSVSLSKAISPGMHYLKIYDHAGKSAIDPYTLTISGVTITAPPLPAPVTSEVESNNAFGDTNVISLHTTVTGKFYPTHDYDWFKVKVEKEGVLNVSVTKVPSGIDAHINLYDPNGNTLGSVTGGVGSPVYLRRDVTLGWYYIRLDDYYDQSTDDYKFIVTLTEAEDANEPNNEFSKAVEVALNETITGYFFPRREYDWFKVNVTTLGVLNVSATKVPTYIDAHINLYDANGHHLAGVSGSVGSSVSLHRDVTPGYYYIRMDDYYDRSAEPYTMLVSLQAVDDGNEPNNEFSKAVEVALDETVTGYYFPTYDYDWFKVNVTTAGIFRISVTEVPTYRRAHVNLYGANAKHLRGVTSEEGTPVTLSYDALPGVYYFRINDYYARSEEPYRFSVSLEGASDEYEPNNDFAHATSIIEAGINAYIFKSDDNDWFKGYVSSTGTISAEITDVPSPYMRLRIEIYDKNNRRLTGVTAPSLGEPVSVSYDVTTTGTYYFRIYDTQGKRSTKLYTVRFAGIDIAENILPVIYDVKPEDGAIVTDNTPEISASYYDIGSGINTSAVTLYLYGQDVTADATVLQAKVSYVPTTPLVDGKHTTTVRVADRAGNTVMKTWSFIVTTKPSVFISLDKASFSSGDTMNITINVLNPTGDVQKANFSLRLNTPAYDYSIIDIPVTLVAGFDEIYLIPYTVGNFGASSFEAQWNVSLLDPETSEIINSDTAEWTYVPGPGASASVMSYGEIVPEKIAEGIKRAVENAEIFK